MVREGFAYGGQGRRDFQEQYGVLETIERVEESDNACSRATKKTVRVLRKPGASPLLFGKFLMTTRAFLSLEDISDNLPRYDESVISVDMDDAIQNAYEQLEEDIRSAMKAHRGNKSLMSILLNPLLLYPDHARTPLIELDEVGAGSHVVEKVLAVIQDLGQTALDRKVRGVLAGNFLEHFDLLIDYPHSIVCLDDSAEMGKKVKVEHIPFSAQAGAQGSATSPQKLIVSAHVPGIEKRMLRLQLDSGINSPLLYGAGEDLKPGRFAGAPLRSRGTDGVEHAFAVLVSQDVQVGQHSLRQSDLLCR